MFYLLAWNNFLYLMGNAPETDYPRIAGYAPWYFVDLTVTPTPPPFPAGRVDLSPTQINKYPAEAGDDWQLKSSTGGAVLYDVRMNQVMYDFTVDNALYCPDSMKQDWFYPPASADGPIANSIETKAAWHDFGQPEDCPSDKMFCQGQYGMVGLHLAQKTPGHGEWIWSSFEFVGNAPDCAPTTPVAGEALASGAPIGSRPQWLFFDEAAWAAARTPEQVATRVCQTPDAATSWWGDADTAEICAGQAPSPTDRALCNQNPRVDLTDDDGGYRPVNVCRVNSLPDPAAVREGPGCTLSGDDDRQTAQLSCANDEIARGMVAVAPGIAPGWVSNYMQIGAEWTLPGAPLDARVDITGAATTAPPITDPAPVAKAGFVHLANTTLETWMQQDLLVPGCGDTGTVASIKAMDCMDCHLGNFPEDETRNGRQNYSHLLERVIGNNTGAACPPAAQ